MFRLTQKNGDYKLLKLENTLYFPDFLVNINNITMLADTLNDDDGTKYITARYSSTFSTDK